MKRHFIPIIIYLFICASPAFAQGLSASTNIGENQDVIEQQIELTPIIKSEEFVEVGKKIIFDASKSIILATGTPQYSWDLGDYTKVVGEEIVHQYDKTGKYSITLEVVQNGEHKQTTQQIFVYDQQSLLIIAEESQKDIELIQLQAAENGVALKMLSAVAGEGGYLSEEKLIKEITKMAEFIKNSDNIIFYTKSSIGLQSFTNFWQNLSVKDQELISKKFFVYITDSSLDVASNLAYQSFKIMKPNYILLTRKEALSPLFALKDSKEATDVLKKRGIEYKVVDDRGKKSNAWVLSGLISHFISKGVPASNIYLILMIPFVACLMVLFRQVIGLSSFGIYTPVITVAAFYILGIRLGIITFFFAVCVGYLVKFILNKFELLYLSKVALNLGLISLSFLMVVWIVLVLDIPVSLATAIFPMLVMTSVAEKFMAAQSEEGFRGALMGIAQTLISVLASYYLITWILFNNIIMSWPEIVFFPLLLILFIGKYSGLRLTEYFRFRSLFSEHNEEE
ncbi:MAG: 7TM domain-containing protein [bacterium]